MNFEISGTFLSFLYRILNCSIYAGHKSCRSKSTELLKKLILPKNLYMGFKIRGNKGKVIFIIKLTFISTSFNIISDSFFCLPYILYSYFSLSFLFKHMLKTHVDLFITNVIIIRIH